MTLLLLALILATPSAQADRGERVETRQHRRAQTQLQEIAEGYWRAVRWNKVSEAAAFLGDPEERIDWLAEGTVEGSFSYRSASVIHLDDDQVLKREVRVQRWYQQDGKWYVVEGERVGVPRQ